MRTASANKPLLMPPVPLALTLEAVLPRLSPRGRAVINFLIIGFCMFLVVKGINTLHKYVLKDDGTAVEGYGKPAK